MDWLTLPCVCHGQTRTGTGLAKLIHIAKHITETHHNLSLLLIHSRRGLLLFTAPDL